MLQGFQWFESVFRDRFRIFDSAAYKASWVFAYPAIHSMHACQHICDQSPRCMGFVFLNYSIERMCVGVNDVGNSAGVDIRDVIGKLPLSQPVDADEIAKRMPVCMRRIEKRRRTG